MATAVTAVNNVFDPPALDHGCNTSCAIGAINYLAQRYPVPDECLARVVRQAVSFCDDFLEAKPVTATSVEMASTHAVETTTATNVETSTITVIVTSTSTSETILTEVSTATTTTPTATVTTTSYVAPAIKVGRRDESPSQSQNLKDCPDLAKTPPPRFPAEFLSSACCCLSMSKTASATKTITTVRTALTFTATLTATATATDITSETALTTTVEVAESSTTTTTTTTSTVSSGTATQTLYLDACSVSFKPSGNGIGNVFVHTQNSTSAHDCCLSCFDTPNCVASAYVGGISCQLLIKKQKLPNAPTNAQCPLGIEDYKFNPGPGPVYRGPCQAGK